AVEEGVVGLDQLGEVAHVELALELAAPLADAGEEHVEARLEVDDQVRLGHAGPELVVDPVVEGHLVPVEVEEREDPVLGEHVVADREAAEELLLEELLLLLAAAEQEEELRLEGVLVAVLVEVGEEGVLLHHLEDPAPVETLGQEMRQGRLADPNRSFDHDVAVLHAVPISSSLRAAHLGKAAEITTPFRPHAMSHSGRFGPPARLPRPREVWPHHVMSRSPVKGHLRLVSTVEAEEAKASVNPGKRASETVAEEP